MLNINACLLLYFLNNNNGEIAHINCYLVYYLVSNIKMNVSNAIAELLKCNIPRREKTITLHCHKSVEVKLNGIIKPSKSGSNMTVFRQLIK